MEFGYEAMKAHVRQLDIDKIERTVQFSPTDYAQKFVHLGYPLGRIVPADQLEQISDTIYQSDGTIPYSTDNKQLNADTCVVSYLHRVLRELISLSCGKCVLCREGLWQLALIFDSISRGSANMERFAFAKELSHAMSIGCDCDFGKGAGRMVELALVDFEDEITDHIRRKRCPSLSCTAFFTMHILPDLCTGCGDCMDECPEDAIEGKSKFIHMIDNDVCDRCGKCVAVCEENAIVKAGPIKPRTPTRLTRVGTFKSARRQADDD